MTASPKAGTKRHNPLLSLSVCFLLLREICGATDACPPDAVAPGCQISVAAYFTNDIPVGATQVPVGKPIVFRMTARYVPFDGTGASLGGFQGGDMTLHANGVTRTVTPLGGVPVVGCTGPVACSSLEMVYDVTSLDATRIVVRAEYRNGNGLVGHPSTIHCTNYALVNVRQSVTPGPLQVSTTNGNPLLHFTGEPQSQYQIEATSDFANWSAIGESIADGKGECRFEDTDARSFAHRFYRYVTN